MYVSYIYVCMNIKIYIGEHLQHLCFNAGCILFYSRAFVQPTTQTANVTPVQADLTISEQCFQPLLDVYPNYTL